MNTVQEIKYYSLIIKEILKANWQVQPNEGPYKIRQVHDNGTVNIWRKTYSENIKEILKANWQVQPNEGPYEIRQIHDNGAVNIWRKTYSENMLTSAGLNYTRIDQKIISTMFISWGRMLTHIIQIIFRIVLNLVHQHNIS